MKRRTLLKAGGAALVAISPLPLLFQQRKPAAAAGANKLVADPAGILDLPAGFHYRVIERALEPMADGYRVPARPDGMACFAGPGGSVTLMRNHENDRNPSQGAYESGAPRQAYDAKAYGGVSRLVVDPVKLERLTSNLVLTGTMRNCAGGASPWGWLSCEENVEPGHGYVFLCRTDATQVANPELIKGYGRFNHEAVCIDPATNAAYLTEDRPDGCLYRFLPNDPKAPFTGKLQALRVVGSPVMNTGEFSSIGKPLAVDWVDLPNGDPADDSLRHQAQALGAAIVRRGEGTFFFQGDVYVCSTSGGHNGTGQIFRLTPESAAKPGTLQLLAESPHESVLDYPDNITVAPWGDVYMAEDGSGEQYVRALTPHGKIIDVARNAKSRSEFAGVCFAPDGKTLFFNMQSDGLTVAVRGPFETLSRV